MASKKRKTIGFKTEEELADAVNGIVNDSDSDTDNIPKFSRSEESEYESANESNISINKSSCVLTFIAYYFIATHTTGMPKLKTGP